MVKSKTKLFESEGKNSKSDRAEIEKIIAYLIRTKQSITSCYNDWLRVAFSISNTFTFDIGLKYYLRLCRLDGVAHDEYKSEMLLNYCYHKKRDNVINFATILYLAKSKSYILKSKNKSTHL